MRSKTLNRGIYILIFTLISFMGMGCMASRTITGNQYETLERFAGNGESEIVVRRLWRYSGAAGMIYINLNGERLGLALRNWESATIAVPNGTHIICAANTYRASKDCAQKSITLNLTSERAVVSVDMGNFLEALTWGSVLARTEKISQIPLGDN